MEVIIKNGSKLSLTNIPENDIKNIKAEVITDFTISDEDKKKIYSGCILNEDFSIIETEEYKEKIKQEKISEIYKTFNDTLAIIEQNYTQKERETFEIKRKEAEKVIAGGTSAFLNALCIEGETTEELANLIIDNSNAYQNLYASAEKTLRETLKEI